MKILFSHPTGNENAKACLQGLRIRNHLSSFHTSVAVFENNIYGRLSEIKFLSMLKRRIYNENLYELTYSYPFIEIGRILLSRLNIKLFNEHEKGIFSVDKAINNLDYNVSKFLLNAEVNINAIYAYEDCALETFKIAKNKGISCFYELPIGYWRSMRNILQNEREKRPEWQCTLTNFRDSEVKLLKKDKELSLADHIFVASTFTSNTLKDCPFKINNVSIIPYGFPFVKEDKEYSKIQNRKLKLLFVGSLTQRKGIANIIEALEILGDEYIELTIVGRKTSNECIPLNKALKKFKWIPTLSHSEILKLMKENDILIFPSLFEGFGMVITEAMAQGTPVITTERTAGYDLIENNQNGWLMEAGSTESLVNILVKLLNNPDSIAENGMAAIKMAKEYSWLDYGNTLVDRILEINFSQ